MSFVSRFSLPLAALAIATVATGANALTLTDARVTGPTGTIWTTQNTGNYTLFLQPELGDYINPNGEDVNDTLTGADFQRFLLAGEGFRPGETIDSDPIYTLTLTFTDNQVLTGQYSTVSNSFLGGNSIVSDGTTFSLVEFSYRRFLGDIVQPNVATPGGDGNDYVGNFRLSAVAGAIPEPATWGLMIAGFAMVGVASRRRSNVSVTA